MYEYLDTLIRLATTESYHQRAQAARKQFFRATGEVFEEDPFYDARMNAFLEFYVFDYVDDGGKTTLQCVMAEHASALQQEQLRVLSGFESQIHSVLEFRKRKGDQVFVVNLLDGAKHTVTERRDMVGVSKADIFEARLLPCDGKLYFGTGFVFHPKEVRKYIVKQLKNVKSPQSGDLTRVLHHLAQLRLRFDRASRVDARVIYSESSGKWS